MKKKIQMAFYNIRVASFNDIQLIRELCFKIWPQTYAAIISKEQIDYMLEMMYSEASLKKQIDDGCIFLLLSENETDIGFASYQHIENNKYKLHKIYVLAAYQGKGAGRYMLNYIIEELSKQKASSLQLQVNRNNKAKEFYERLGFSVIKEADFDIGNGYFMNDFIMEKNFKV